MEVMVAVQSGTLLHALRVQLKRRVSARRGGDYNEVPQAIQKKSRPSPSNCVTPFLDLSLCKISSLALSLAVTSKFFPAPHLITSSLIITESGSK